MIVRYCFLRTLMLFPERIVDRPILVRTDMITIEKD